MQMAQEWITDTQILEQKIVLPSKPVGPEAIEDFLCNFLIRMGMTRTLDCFQSEWLKLHYASYEPTIRVLLEKHQTLLKQKMLTCLHRDRAAEQLFLVIKRKVPPEGRTQKALPEAREQTKCNGSMKDNAKASFSRNQEEAYEFSARSTLSNSMPLSAGVARELSNLE